MKDLLKTEKEEESTLHSIEQHMLLYGDYSGEVRTKWRNGQRIGKFSLLGDFEYLMS